MKTTTAKSRPPSWMRQVLIAAGVYNLIWGALVIIRPGLLFDLAGMEPPRYAPVWQSVGMIVGVYGIGYLIAAGDHRRHWPIVLVGFLGKIFGPAGFVFAVLRGELPIEFGLTILTNDLIWWIPFALILWDAFRASMPMPPDEPVALEEALETLTDQSGRTLGELSDERPVLTVLLRHSGCTFCREALRDLADRRTGIESSGAHIAVITMSDVESATKQTSAYGLDGVSVIADPERLAYRALEVPRGTFAQLFGPSVFLRGVGATLRGNWVGRLDGDGLQMPGAFVIDGRRVVRSYRHRTAADRPDYVALACEAPA